jgi:hypothetical protein
VLFNTRFIVWDMLLWLWTAEQQCSAFTLMYAQVQYRIVLPCSFTSISFLITLHNIHFITYFWEYRFYNGHSLINLLIYWLMFNANLSCIMISNVVRNSHVSIYIHIQSYLGHDNHDDWLFLIYCKKIIISWNRSV